MFDSGDGTQKVLTLLPTLSKHQLLKQELEWNLHPGFLFDLREKKSRGQGHHSISAGHRLMSSPSKQVGGGSSGHVEAVCPPEPLGTQKIVDRKGLEKIAALVGFRNNRSLSRGPEEHLKKLSRTLETFKIHPQSSCWS